MIGLVIATHGDLAKGLCQTSEMFLGKLQNTKNIGLQSEESAIDFQERLEGAVREVNKGKGVLILTDLNGGTPFNRGIMVKSAQPDQLIEVFSGVNLPMVIDALNHQILNSTFETTVTSILNEAINGIATATSLLATADEEDEF